MYVLLSFLLICVGLFMLLKPEIFYELTEGWKNRSSGSPSRSYLLSTRFGGVMMLLAGGMGVAVWLLG